MNDENWKEEYKEWNPDLKPYQIKLLEEGAQSQSQTLMLADMWCEWKKLAFKQNLKQITTESIEIEDPWYDKETEIIAPYG